MSVKGLLLASGGAAVLYGLWWLSTRSFVFRKDRTDVSRFGVEQWSANTYVFHVVTGAKRHQAAADMHKLGTEPDNSGTMHVVCQRCWALDEQTK